MEFIVFSLILLHKIDANKKMGEDILNISTHFLCVLFTFLTHAFNL